MIYTLNEILEEEGSGWRIVGRTLSKIISDVEIETIEEALKNLREATELYLEEFPYHSSSIIITADCFSVLSPA